MLSQAKSLTLTLALALVPKLAAQPPLEPGQLGHITVGPGMAMQTKAGMTIGLHMENLDAAPVKGSPFCATVTSEHTQMFADGNRIHTTEDSSLCRDKEGRTRREAQLNLLGAVQQNTAQKLITIVDPVAGFRYTLDTGAKMARKMSLSAGLPSLPDLPKGGGQNFVFYSKTGHAEGMTYSTAGSSATVVKNIAKKIAPNSAGAAPTSEPTSESLGDQTIGGIHATGTRVTTSIPAGTMGNDQPISVVSENWYSPELKTTVMTKHSDPWAGQLTTQFTNVNTSEPEGSLFTVPSDYKIVDENTEPFMIKVRP